MSILARVISTRCHLRLPEPWLSFVSLGDSDAHTEMKVVRENPRLRRIPPPRDYETSEKRDRFRLCQENRL